MRSKGPVPLMIIGKASVFVNSFLSLIDLQYAGWKYYVVYVGWLGFERLAIYIFIFDTTLEAIWEKFNALDHKDKNNEAGGSPRHSLN
jgi:hypothetical protein